MLQRVIVVPKEAIKRRLISALFHQRLGIAQICAVLPMILCLLTSRIIRSVVKYYPHVRDNTTGVVSSKGRGVHHHPLERGAKGGPRFFFCRTRRAGTALSDLLVSALCSCVSSRL